ncbi:hypothetical protein HGRIS_011970 [Hohenbuehelia grisea]|uniref:Uncharacterized protein n=1 Tax=Hohenbuehelia grisea TaxID=104357 RepID=A0ABR3JWV8_9AGAR
MGRGVLDGSHSTAKSIHYRRRAEGVAASQIPSSNLVLETYIPGTDHRVPQHAHKPLGTSAMVKAMSGDKHADVHATKRKMVRGWPIWRA